MDDSVRNNNGPNSDNNRIQNDYWKWFLIYIGIGIAISFLIPFPISFAVYLLLFFVLNAVRTDINLRKSGMNGGIRGLYKSLSSGFGNGGIGYTPLKFSCMNCGKEHNERACPKCGSTAVRVV
jgi:hypothetical protein